MHEEFGLSQLFFLLRRRWIWLLLSTLLGLAAAFAYSTYFITPKYESSVDLYVKNSMADTIIQGGTIDQGQITTARTLANTCIVILKNDDVLAQVAADLGNKVSVGQLKSVLTLTPIDSTEVIRISALTESPSLSAEICNAVVAIAPETLIDIVKAGSVAPIGAANPASSPASPNVRQNTLLGGLLGLALAAGIVLLIFKMDNSVKGEDDLAQRVKAPILGEIPRLQGSAPVDGTSKQGKSRNYYASTNHAFESYKIVRANLLFTLADAKSNIILVSSAEPNAGKSTTTANLAISMALTGAKVLVLDADMRRPTLHKIFRLPNSAGLSKVISGEESFEESLHRNLVVENLDFLSAGVTPPNPSELLGSKRAEELMLEWSSRYDYIFVDTPPVNVVADALMLSPLAAGVLFVARQKQTHYEELKRAIGTLENLNNKVLGILVTDVSWKNKTYGYGRYKRYSYSSYYYEKPKTE